jgi:hypothetical protein
VDSAQGKKLEASTPVCCVTVFSAVSTKYTDFPTLSHLSFVAKNKQSKPSSLPRCFLLAIYLANKFGKLLEQNNIHARLLVVFVGFEPKQTFL